MSAVQTTLADAVQSQLIEAREVARLYGGVSVRTIWRWSDKGNLPKSVKLGSKRFWARSSIEKHLAGMAAQAN